MSPRAPRPRPERPTSIAELEITAIAAGGDGVGRHEGMVAFVPRTAPGDLARVRLAAQGRFARGELVELLRPAAARVEPPCPHYVVDRCGGCQLQHLAYEAQLAAKSGIVRDALVRIARREVEAPTVSPSPRAWRYRRKLTMALRRREGRWIAGLHPYDDPAAVFDLVDCPITDERVIATWREIMAASERLPRERELRGAVRLLDEGASFVLEGGVEWGGARAFFGAVPSLRALWWKPTGGARRLVERRGAEGAAGASFVQVNPEVARALHAHVLDVVGRHAPATVVDAYAGTGSTAVPLAAAGARVTAIEVDREAVELCAARLPAGSRAIAGRVEDRLPEALPADVVVLNPPRGGVHESVPAALAAARPRAVVYVSCDPATLARDLARLPGYRVASLRSFDMFPQTAHVESVCELVPEAA